MSEPFDQVLHDELVRRRNTDQAVRVHGDVHQGVLVDEENTEWLKRIVAERGWPGRRLVGDDGAAAAWLLAQHADADLTFQRRCLGLLRDAVRDGDAPLWQWAYLLDRVALAEGRALVFGTQVWPGSGGYQPRRLHHPIRADSRRAAVGLPHRADTWRRSGRNRRLSSPPCAVRSVAMTCRSESRSPVTRPRSSARATG